MSSLQSQLHDLHKEISRRDSEITNHQQTIKMMQEKQRYLSGESGKAEDTIRQLRNELSMSKENSLKSHMT